jgi:ribokinase
MNSPELNKSILVIGSINADLYVEVPRIPQPGETLMGQDASMLPGGKGANQAVAAARLGANVWFAGKLGSDAYAPPLQMALESAGVELDLLDQIDGPSGQAIILLQPNGANAIIVVGGANQEWIELSDAVHDRLRTVGAVLLQGEVPVAINLEAAHAARAAGVPVFLDAGGNGGQVLSTLLPLVDVLSPNEHELSVLSDGMPIHTNEEILAAARAIQAKGAHTLLIKLGHRGAMLVPEQGKPLVHSAFQVKTVDTTGAGDCFTAAYAVATVGGMQQQARLRFACAAAALSVMRKGAIPSMPNREAVKRFLMNNSNATDLTAYE